MKLKLLFGLGIVLALLLSGCGQSKTSSDIVLDDNKSGGLYDPNLQSDAQSYLTKCKITWIYVTATYTKATLTGSNCEFSWVKCTGAWKDRCSSSFGTVASKNWWIWFNKISATRWNYFVY